jgi:hypothetical protein
MKKLIAAVAVGLFTACFLSAQTTPAVKTDAKTDPKPAAKVAPKPADKAAPKTVVKVEEPKIPGTMVARANGTFLGLEVVGGNFKLSFYDKKKKAMAPDVTRVSARWPNPRAPGDNRTILNLSGSALVGTKPVIAPFTFNVYLTFLKAEGDNTETATESYVVPFRG